MAFFPSFCHRHYAILNNNTILRQHILAIIKKKQLNRHSIEPVINSNGKVIKSKIVSMIDPFSSLSILKYTHDHSELLFKLVYTPKNLGV